jgi:hypothetical protein
VKKKISTGREDVHLQNRLNGLILNWCIGGCWFTPASKTQAGTRFGFQNRDLGFFLRTGTKPELGAQFLKNRNWNWIKDFLFIF